MKSTGPEYWGVGKFFNEENSLMKWTVPRRFWKNGKPKGVELTEEEEESPSELQTMLYGVFPPREWEEGGLWWRQKVSDESCTRMDVIKLSQRLDNMMINQNAREKGICDIRHRLHSQLFDEITRQTIIYNTPLGLLLNRVRDDVNATFLCYRALFESSVEYGLKKASKAEQGRRELEDIIETLKVETEQLEEEKKYAMKSVYEKERRSVAEKDLLEALHIEKMEHYDQTNKALKELLDTIMISKM